jgi:membrane protein
MAERTAGTNTTDRTRQDAETADKPDSPTDLSKPSWKYIVGKSVREFSKDQCTDLAAALTYYAVLALFPALLAMVSLLGLIGQASTTESLVGILDEVGAGSVAGTIRGPLQELTQNSAAGLGLILGLAGALWSASGYVGAFGRAMNRVYEIDEGRPFWKLRPLMIIVTLIAVILAGVVAIGLVVTGPLSRAIGDAIGLGETAVTVWNIAKWPLLAALAALVVAILYYATPNVKQPKFRWISIGAVVAILTWVIASAAFGFYVSQFSNYNKTYGSLGGVIIFLLWLWITNLALLFGAELDAEMERGRQLQAGIPAEREIQLPPRDTTTIDKKAAQAEKDIKQGERLRRSAGQTATEPASPAGDRSTTTRTSSVNTDSKENSR